MQFTALELDAFSSFEKQNMCTVPLNFFRYSIIAAHHYAMWIQFDWFSLQFTLTQYSNAILSKGKLAKQNINKHFNVSSTFAVLLQYKSIFEMCNLFELSNTLCVLYDSVCIVKIRTVLALLLLLHFISPVYMMWMKERISSSSSCFFSLQKYNTKKIESNWYTTEGKKEREKDTHKFLYSTRPAVNIRIS